VPGEMVHLSTAYVPVLIKGLRVHPDNPLLFDFILDSGKSGLQVNSPEFKAESQKLIKYFLASLTIKEDDLWVNLSPYEKNRIIPEQLGQTELGREMLAQDYILKQLTASLIYPEKQLGQEFWDRVYSQARQMFGTSNIPVNTFNKVWIVADKAKVLERNNVGYVVGAHLKVMLEEDYLSLSRHVIPAKAGIHNLTSQILREIIIPQLEKEVNQGEHFAPLRQMYYSMILATWYKRALKDALLNEVYSNKGKIGGVLSNDPAGKEKIYQQYLRAYKKGVFNYIKEDMDIISKQPIPHKYFSGGEKMRLRVGKNLLIEHTQATDDAPLQEGDLAMVTVNMTEKEQAQRHDSSMMARPGWPKKVPSTDPQLESAIRKVFPLIKKIFDKMNDEIANKDRVQTGDIVDLLHSLMNLMGPHVELYKAAEENAMAVWGEPTAQSSYQEWIYVIRRVLFNLNVLYFIKHGWAIDIDHNRYKNLRLVRERVKFYEIVRDADHPVILVEADSNDESIPGQGMLHGNDGLFIDPGYVILSHLSDEKLNTRYLNLLAFAQNEMILKENPTAAQIAGYLSQISREEYRNISREEFFNEEWKHYLEFNEEEKLQRGSGSVLNAQGTRQHVDIAFPEISPNPGIRIIRNIFNSRLAVLNDQEIPITEDLEDIVSETSVRAERLYRAPSYEYFIVVIVRLVWEMFFHDKVERTSARIVLYSLERALTGQPASENADDWNEFNNDNLLHSILLPEIAKLSPQDLYKTVKRLNDQAMKTDAQWHDYIRASLKNHPAVLLVEDDPSFRDRWEQLLQELGLNVLVAGNYIDGMRTYMANRDKIGLVITDDIMPRDPEAELARWGEVLRGQVHHRDEHMPVIWQSKRFIEDTVDEEGLIWNKEDVEGNLRKLLKGIDFAMTSGKDFFTRRAIKDQGIKYLFESGKVRLEKRNSQTFLTMQAGSSSVEVRLSMGFTITSYKPFGREVFYQAGDTEKTTGSFVMATFVQQNAERPNYWEAIRHGDVRDKPWVVESIHRIKDGIEITGFRDVRRTVNGQEWRMRVTEIYRLTSDGRLLMRYKIKNTGKVPVLANHGYHLIGIKPQGTAMQVTGQEALITRDSELATGELRPIEGDHDLSGKPRILDKSLKLNDSYKMKPRWHADVFYLDMKLRFESDASVLHIWLGDDARQVTAVETLLGPANAQNLYLEGENLIKEGKAIGGYRGKQKIREGKKLIEVSMMHLQSPGKEIKGFYLVTPYDAAMLETPVWPKNPVEKTDPGVEKAIKEVLPLIENTFEKLNHDIKTRGGTELSGFIYPLMGLFYQLTNQNKELYEGAINKVMDTWGTPADESNYAAWIIFFRKVLFNINLTFVKQGWLIDISWENGILSLIRDRVKYYEIIHDDHQPVILVEVEPNDQSVPGYSILEDPQYGSIYGYYNAPGYITLRKIEDRVLDEKYENFLVGFAKSEENIKLSPTVMKIIGYLSQIDKKEFRDIMHEQVLAEEWDHYWQSRELDRLKPGSSSILNTKLLKAYIDTAFPEVSPNPATKIVRNILNSHLDFHAYSMEELVQITAETSAMAQLLYFAPSYEHFIVELSIVARLIFFKDAIYRQSARIVIYALEKALKGDMGPVSDEELRNFTELPEIAQIDPRDLYNKVKQWQNGVPLKQWDQEYIWHPFTQMKDWVKDEPLIIDSADGIYLKDIDGNIYMDGVSSLWVNVHGHRHAHIDAALKKQIDKLSHSTLLGLSNTPAIELAKRLVRSLPRV
jgi:hypothetical protein